MKHRFDTMMTKKEKKRVPELRFPGFEGEWEEKNFKEVVKINQGLQISIADRLLEYEEGALFYITNEFLNPNSNKRYFIKNASKSVICSEDDILMTRTGNTGKVVTNVKGAFHNNFFRIAYPKTVYKEFLFNFLILPKTQDFIIRLAGTSTIPDLNHSDFYKIKFISPPFKEQQKIATFLTSIDTRIQQLEKKKTLLEQYKKGVMQKIFKQEIRFKDEEGKEFPKWDKVKYSKLYSFIRTNSYSRNDLNYEQENVRNIHYGDIHTKFTTLFDITKELVPFINLDIDISRYNDEDYCKEGDLVIADASEDYADIGKTIEIVNINNEKVLAGLHTFLARPLDNRMAIGFAAYMLQSWSVRKQIMTIAQGTKVISLSTGRLGNVILPIPCKLEQTKIAHFLTAIDTKIAVTTEQVEQTKKWKKGLLQRMFV